LNFNDLDEIKKAGFTGFRTVEELFADHTCIDKVKGIYLVLYLDTSHPKFLQIGTGPALYKKKTNPNVAISVLKSNWIDKTIVIYIGKAGGKNSDGEETKATLRSRLLTYLNFGKGKDVRHYGGRFIWQLANYKELVFCWKKLPDEEPYDVETTLICDFRSVFGKRPFANHTK